MTQGERHIIPEVVAFRKRWYRTIAVIVPPAASVSVIQGPELLVRVCRSVGTAPLCTRCDHHPLQTPSDPPNNSEPALQISGLLGTTRFMTTACFSFFQFNSLFNCHFRPSLHFHGENIFLATILPPEIRFLLPRAVERLLRIFHYRTKRKCNWNATFFMNSMHSNEFFRIL